MLIERIKNLSITSSLLRDQPTGWLHQDHQTSGTHWIQKRRLITGSMKTDFGMKRIEITKSREHKCTWSKDSYSQDISSVSKPSCLLSTVRWLPIPDMLGIRIRRLTSLSFHQVRLCKLLGMVNSFSSEDWQSLKSRTPTHYQRQLNLIKNLLLHFHQLVTPKYWCAQLFAHIWVASQSHILEPIKVGYACATDLYMINSVVSDKAQLKQTYHISTTLCMDQSCVLKSRSSLTSHPFTCMSEMHWFDYRCWL